MKLNVPGLTVEDVGSTGIIVVFRWTCVVVSSGVVVNAVILISNANDEVPDEVIFSCALNWLDIDGSATVVVVNVISVVGVTVDVNILDISILDDSEADGTGLMTGDSVVIIFSSDENIDIFATSGADVDGSIVILNSAVAPDDGSIDVLVSNEIVATVPAPVGGVDAIVDVAASNEDVHSFISELAVVVDFGAPDTVDPAR